MSESDRTIRTLVDDLTPIGRPPDFGRISIAWWIMAMIFTAGAMLLVQPFRPGFLDQLVASPRFALESIVGLIVCAGIARVAFGLGIPDVRSPWRRSRVTMVLLALWLGSFGFAVLSPVFAPSMAGKRPLCNLEVLLYAIPLTVAGLVILRRMMPLNRTSAGAWMGFAAGLVPAYLMQLACMHEPVHIISFHLLPTFGTALIGGVLGRWMLRHA